MMSAISLKYKRFTQVGIWLCHNTFIFYLFRNTDVEQLEEPIPGPSGAGDMPQKRRGKRKVKEDPLESAIISLVQTQKAKPHKDHLDLYFDSCAARAKNLNQEQKALIQVQISQFFQS